MSTNVSSPAWSQDPVGLSEKQPSRSWTKPSTSGGGLGAGARHRPPTGTDAKRWSAALWRPRVDESDALHFRSTTRTDMGPLRTHA